MIHLSANATIRGVIACCTAMLALSAAAAEPAVRPRVIVETDAGGDPDDEQSMVRFLLYGNDLDVEGIICTRARARDGENRNPQRSGLGIVRRLLDAYGDCHANLVKHDPRYPTKEHLWERTVAGYADSDDGVRLILEAVDKADDPRPVWFCNWGTDAGSAPSSLQRALDKVLAERGPAGYAAFKRRLRLSSDDKFGDHTFKVEPAFPIWVDTFRPPVDGKRYYHRFSAITAKAGGFDLARDCLAGHGPLGALYPTNTTHVQKEGDTMTFLHLVPNGLGDPERPTWGSWAGRYAPRDDAGGRPYYWASARDALGGTTHRDNALKRWAAHLQNDFAARLDWCAADAFAKANHPPVPRVKGSLRPTLRPGQTLTLDASESTDPDAGQTLGFRWIVYGEPGTYAGPPVAIKDADRPIASLVVPQADAQVTLHVLLILTDSGTPPLTRYQRVILTIAPAP